MGDVFNSINSLSVVGHVFCMRVHPPSYPSRASRVVIVQLMANNIALTYCLFLLRPGSRDVADGAVLRGVLEEQRARRARGVARPRERPEIRRAVEHGHEARVGRVRDQAHPIRRVLEA